MKKIVASVLILFFLGTGLVHADNSTLDQAIAAAKAQADKDAADASVQQQKAQAAQAAGDTKGATVAADLAQVDAADATYQTALIAMYQLQETGTATPEQLAAAQAKVNAAGAALNQKRAAYYAAIGDTQSAQKAAQASLIDAQGAQQNAIAAGAPANSSDANPGFVSLTKIPGLENAGNATDLATFLNTVYKICIGLAAVIAVLQIVRAGIMYMGGDSVTEKSAARNLIVNSLVGLLLVLSPVIVFSIINKNILSLKINNLGALKIDSTAPTAGGAAPSGSATPAGACGTQYASYDIDGFTQLPAGQQCSDVFQANDVPIPVACCDNSATPTPGYTCCAQPPAASH